MAPASEKAPRSSQLDITMIIGRWRNGDLARACNDRYNDRMKVSDMMSINLLTCRPGDTVRAVARQMHARNVGSVLVVEDGVMTGIFTERDLVRLVASGAPLHAARVGDHAAGDVATVPPDTDAADAAALMNRLRIRHLPITDGATLVGMVSLRDFFALSGAVLRAQGSDAASALLRAAT